jgi:hypothetical protein
MFMMFACFFGKYSSIFNSRTHSLGSSWHKTKSRIISIFPYFFLVMITKKYKSQIIICPDMTSVLMSKDFHYGKYNFLIINHF